MGESRGNLDSRYIGHERRQRVGASGRTSNGAAGLGRGGRRAEEPTATVGAASRATIMESRHFDGGAARDTCYPPRFHL